MRWAARGVGAAREPLEEDSAGQGRSWNKKRGREPRVPDPEQAQPNATAQRNFTDPESRIMPDGANKGSFVQGYNGQIAIDSASQVIVAAEITQEMKRPLPALRKKRCRIVIDKSSAPAPVCC
jgi:hypothetical protein